MPKPELKIWIMAKKPDGGDGPFTILDGLWDSDWGAEIEKAKKVIESLLPKENPEA